VKDRLVVGYNQKRPIAIRKADLSSFSAEEIAMVNYVMEQLAGKSATAVSELSHRFAAWKAAADGEEIPYYTALLSDREPTADDYAFARDLAAGSA
jgi:hypothetical protein